MDKDSKYKSVGVTAMLAPFLPSDDEQRENETYEIKSHSNDADVSSLSTIDAKIPKNPQHSSTQPDYYYLKTVDRKGQKELPSRIEFQLVNNGLKKKIGKNQCKCCHQQAVDSQLKNNLCMQFETAPHFCVNAEDTANRDGNDQNRQTFGEVFTTLCNCYQGSETGSCHGDVEAQKLPERDADFSYNPPYSRTDRAAKAVFDGATQFWAEIFGLVNILIAIPLAFILQVFWFILHSMLRSVVIGFMQMIIEIIIIPIMSLVKKVLETFCGIFEPAVRLFSELVKPIAECLRAIRIVDVNINKRSENYRKHDEFIV